MEINFLFSVDHPHSGYPHVGEIYSIKMGKFKAPNVLLALRYLVILTVAVIPFFVDSAPQPQRVVAQVEPDPIPVPVDSSGTGKTSNGFFSGLISSFSMIVVSELGDKTFFIAAIMAMRHSRLIVFAGAISALGLMTVLSALFGGYVTTLIPRFYTYYISTALFAIFGMKMLYDGFKMGEDEGLEEMEDVQQDLRQREENENTPLTSSTSSSSAGLNKLNSSEVKPSKLYARARRFLYSIFSRVYLQSLTMTFLAEWGDRSQLATVVLAAREDGKDIWGTCVGGVVGHALCTGLAVVGGRIIAQRISVKTVTIIGGFVFLGFAIVSLFMDPN
ncbi:Transmembrane protein [Orchesella cincta]|uniref:GDT1 family protein n=1 Tax=Orchesella cincta TaxID=48709 RepID=A0A1D2NFR8_ORCCI|nr:Transmembrane protein [Orchesella cincta]